MGLTAVICTRNRTDQLQRALLSLMNQTLPPNEIIVVDNAPTDNATRLLVTKQYPDVRYVHEAAAGLDFARNRALGESSQEIGDIVEIINGIAEQTNVLALNAAIQAASAGGAGKVFAVVADEVQQLAESATNATRRIETLVQTIQTDTSEAVVSMESTTTEVVSGARLAEAAGTALEQIELVSKELSEMIADISGEANAQSATATDISKLMKSVQEISVQASEGSAQAATSVEDLAELVMQLSDSVTDFKLPQDD